MYSSGGAVRRAKGVSPCFANNGMHSAVKVRVDGRDVKIEIRFYLDELTCRTGTNYIYNVSLANMIVQDNQGEFYLKPYTHNVVVEASRIYSFCKEQKDFGQAREKMFEKEAWIQGLIFIGNLYKFVFSKEDNSLLLKGYVPMRNNNGVQTMEDVLVKFSEVELM